MCFPLNPSSSFPSLLVFTLPSMLFHSLSSFLPLCSLSYSSSPSYLLTIPLCFSFVASSSSLLSSTPPFPPLDVLTYPSCFSLLPFVFPHPLRFPSLSFPQLRIYLPISLCFCLVPFAFLPPLQLPSLPFLSFAITYLSMLLSPTFHLPPSSASPPHLPTYLSLFASLPPFIFIPPATPPSQPSPSSSFTWARQGAGNFNMQVFISVSPRLPQTPESLRSAPPPEIVPMQGSGFNEWD